MKMVKNVIYIMLLVLVFGCKQQQSGQSLEIDNKELKSEPQIEDSDTEKLLCKINGRPWHYTKASGIITLNRRTEEKLITVTFDKKMDKRTENVQLYYDAKTKQLKNTTVSIYVEQNKLPGFKGGLARTDYALFSRDEKESGEILSGTVELSSDTALSGEAMATIAHHAKRLIKNKGDETVTISDLKFENVSYSDLTKPLGH